MSSQECIVFDFRPVSFRAHTLFEISVCLFCFYFVMGGMSGECKQVVCAIMLFRKVDGGARCYKGVRNMTNACNYVKHIQNVFLYYLSNVRCDVNGGEQGQFYIYGEVSYIYCGLAIHMSNV